jgi:hypothetical protein
MPAEEPELTASELEALEREHAELRCRLHGLAWEYLQRSGRLPGGPRPEEEVAARLGLSRRQCRRVLARALSKLREALADSPPRQQP